MKKPEPQPRPRGRPRSFDEAAVLASLLDVFWKKGYSRASLEDLESAAGVNRPSLYTAFGDKQGMYARALAEFESRMAARLAPTLDPARPLREGLRAFYLQALDLYTADRPAARGCFVFCTAVTEAVEDEALRDTVAAVMERVDRALAMRFVQAAERGEITTDISAARLGLAASALLQSLALRSRAGTSRPRLIEFIDAGIAVLLGPAPAKPSAASKRPRRRAA